MSEPPPPPPPPSEPPPSGPDDHQYASDIDEDGDVDYVHTFDVAEHSIAEVKAHVESHPGSEQFVLDAELARGAAARSTLIDWLTARLA